MPHIKFTIKPSSKDTIEYDIYNVPFWETSSSDVIHMYEEGNHVSINNPHELRKLKIMN